MLKTRTAGITALLAALILTALPAVAAPSSDDSDRQQIRSSSTSVRPTPATRVSSSPSLGTIVRQRIVIAHRVIELTVVLIRPEHPSYVTDVSDTPDPVGIKPTDEEEEDDDDTSVTDEEETQPFWR